MKSIKKIVIAFLALCLFCVAFAACGEQTAPLSGEYMGPKGERYVFTNYSMTIMNVEGVRDATLRCSYRIVTEEDGTERITVTRESYSYSGMDPAIKSLINDYNSAIDSANSAARQTEYVLKRGDGYIMLDKLWLMEVRE